MPNRDPDTVQLWRDTAKATVKGVQELNVSNRLWVGAGVVPWAWNRGREQIDARRRQSIGADFRVALWIV